MFPTVNSLDQQWTEMVSAFVQAGVPLNVFGNEALRTWIEKYVTSGAHLPCVSTLPTKLDNLAEADKEKTNKWCENKDVCITADETTDTQARKVLHILVKPLGSQEKSRLVMTAFLDKVDAEAIVQHVTKAMTSLGLQLNQLVIFCSDNAPYMMKAGQDLKGVSPRLIHTTCWAHVLHLVSEEIREQLPETDKLVSLMKRALIKCPARKVEFLEYMEKNEGSSSLPPIPVLTRWTTWLHAASFHWAHFTTLQDWVTNTKDNSPVMVQLKNLFRSQSQIVAEQLERIAQIYPSLSLSIKELEKDDVSSSQVWPSLQLILRYLESLGIPSAKLATYINQKHPAIEFWRDVQIFDPRNCPTNFSTSGIPKSLLRFSKTVIPFSELIAYEHFSNEEIGSKISVQKFWVKYVREMPNLSELALNANSVPPSSAPVERSFSFLKKLLAPQRTNLIEKNLESHLRITFNTSKVPLHDEENQCVEVF